MVILSKTETLSWKCNYIYIFVTFSKNYNITALSQSDIFIKINICQPHLLCVCLFVCIKFQTHVQDDQNFTDYFCKNFDLLQFFTTSSWCADFRLEGGQFLVFKAILKLSTFIFLLNLQILNDIRLTLRNVDAQIVLQTHIKSC